jgi:hypothetical protein
VKSPKRKSETFAAEEKIWSIIQRFLMVRALSEVPFVAVGAAPEEDEERLCSH